MLDELGLLDIYSTLHTQQVQWTLSGTHGTLLRIVHIQGHKISVNKVMKTKLFQVTFQITMK